MNNYIKDTMKDILRHTHDLGVFEMVKIKGTAESTEVEHRTITTPCGEFTGNYASELNYAFSLSGVPADLLGMEVDTFNIDINDCRYASN